MPVVSPSVEYSRRPRLYWLGDGGARSPDLVGDEAACLSALPGEVPVPAAFCMTALSPYDLLPDELDEVWELLTDAYERMQAVTGQVDPRLVVRRSSRGSAPRASIPPTFLNIVGLEGLTAAIHEVLAWPAPARRVDPWLPAAALGGRGRSAVLVQLFVPAEVSARVVPVGLSGPGAESTDVPATGGPDTRMAITATWGLGESLADGATPADLFVVDNDLRIVRRDTTTKDRMTVLADGGVVNVFVPSRLRDAACLNEDEARRVAELYRRAKRQLGCRRFGMTVAVTEGRLVVVSCAPLP